MRLEADGIETLIRDAHMTRMDPIMSNVMGGIRIDVLSADVERANEILGLSGVESRARNPTKLGSCPRCGGANLGYASRNRGMRG